MKSASGTPPIYPYLVSILMVLMLVADRYNATHTASLHTWSFPAALITLPISSRGQMVWLSWAYLLSCLLSTVLFFSFIIHLKQSDLPRNIHPFWLPNSMIAVWLLLFASSYSVGFYHAAPIFVSLHFLICLILIIQCWFWGVMNHRDQHYLNYRIKPLRAWLTIGLVFWFLEMSISIWSSSHHTGIACTAAHSCSHLVWSTEQIKQLFMASANHNLNYRHGLWSMNLRSLLQALHQLISYVFSIYVLIIIALICLRNRYHSIQYYGWFFLSLLIVEVTLGILDSIWVLPTWVDLAHSGLSIIWIITWMDLLFYSYNISQPRLKGHIVG